MIQKIQEQHSEEIKEMQKEYAKELDVYAEN